MTRYRHEHLNVWYNLMYYQDSVNYLEDILLFAIYQNCGNETSNFTLSFNNYLILFVVYCIRSFITEKYAIPILYPY